MWTLMNKAMPPASECYIKGWPEQQATRKAASNNFELGPLGPQAASTADSAVRSRDVRFNPRDCNCLCRAIAHCVGQRSHFGA